MRPPLTNELFAFRQRSAFHRIFSSYTHANTLAPELGYLSTKGSLRLEEKLLEYATHENQGNRRAFRDIPAYLRDIMEQTGRSYVEVPGSYVQLVKRLIRDYPHEVAFVVLNYDILLEQALSYFGGQFQNLDDYHSSENPAMVVKIHGSINWFHPIGHLNFGWDALVDKFDPMEGPFNIAMIKSEYTTRQIEYEGQHVYPILTAPLVGKDPSQLVCPRSHLEHLQPFLQDCEKVLIIGSSGQDDDLFHLLKESLGAPRIVHYVGGRDVSKVSGRFERGVPQLPTGTKSKYFDFGFLKYVMHDAFEEFLKS